MIDNLPILSNGKQEPGSGKVCAEQAVNWLVSGRLDLGDETDHPSCVQPFLNALSIAVNDRLDDTNRLRMWPLILRQPGTARPEMEPMLSVRLAAFAARQVLDLTGKYRPQAEGAITAAEEWSDCPCDKHARAATAARAAYAANAANANAAAYAAYAARAANANAANAAARAAYASDRLLALLEATQDEHARLTGHLAGEVDTARVERLGQLVGIA